MSLRFSHADPAPSASILFERCYCDAVERGKFPVNARQWGRVLMPPIVRDWRLRMLDRSVRYHGRPTTWAEARGMSDGYAAGNILDRVVSAARTVAAGQARYERDSMLFHDSVFPFAVLAALLRAAVRNDNRIEVVDFGGSLGSTYRQCRPFFDPLATVEWTVVEQPEFVAAGQLEFGSEELQFARSLSDVRRVSVGATVLASSVLQYMEDPSAVLAMLEKLPARHLVIDRTPLSEEPADRLCIQHVPKTIYSASYPCWILSRSRLLSRLSSSWRVVSDFGCIDGASRTDDGMPFEYRGLILERP